MSRRITYLLICQALLVALFASCEKKGPAVDNTVPELELSTIPIEFRNAEFTAETKGNMLTNESIEDFGVFSIMKNYPQTDAFHVYMDNVKTAKSVTGNVWSTTPTYYWPQLPDKELTFFAYAPYKENNDLSEMVQENGEWKMKITHNVPENPVQQVDLCVARDIVPKTIKNTDLEKPIEMNFAHTLTSVTFAANYVGTLPENTVLRVSGLKVSNVLNTGTLAVNSKDEKDTPWFEWSPDNTQKGDVIMTTYNGALKTAENNIVANNGKNDNHVTLLMGGVDAYMIPQTINEVGVQDADQSILSMTLSYYEPDPKVQGVMIEVAQFATEVLLPRTEWNAGRKVKYAFTIDVDKVWIADIVVTANQVEPWVNSENEHFDTTIK